MKKNFFFLAAAALAFASCSVDETLEVNQGEAIGFRTVVNGNTRAADITTANIAEFTVEAINNGSDPATSYFSNQQFTKSGTTFVSDPSYYWPANALDFYAYSPTTNGQVSKTDYKTFVVTPSATVAEQVDLVYANVTNATKASSSTGVPLNFRHTGSKIVCQVKNSDKTMKFTVTGWKVGYLDNAGTFTYAGTTTAGAGTLPVGCWSNNTTFSADNTYTMTLGSAKEIAPEANATLLDGEMILVPQTTTAATAYAADAADSKLNGSYIAVEIQINNTDASETLIQNKIWAIWPVGFTWVPGKKYTYTVDLAGGGYKEANDGATEEAGHETDLDPILDNAIIYFATVTVDDWSEETGIDVDNN